MSVSDARALLEDYTSIQRAASFGIAALAARIDDAESVARTVGTSIGKARDAVETGKVMAGSAPLSDALKRSEISLEQATEIAKAEGSAPGSASSLVDVARSESFFVLREKARKAKLESEQHRDLFVRQRTARSARSYTDDLGMVNVNLVMQPHVGTPIVARAEAEAQRRAREAKRNGNDARFERHLADAYAAMLSESSVKGRAKRPELVVLVSHEVAERGWTEVKAGEVCKIPGVGPIEPKIAREIARDAFINAVVCDGKDLRHFKRWTKHIPVEIELALELGSPPEFEGIRCVDCGNRFHTEFDHVDPRANGGPTSLSNFDGRCWSCHVVKTTADRKAGKLTPAKPDATRPGPSTRSGKKKSTVHMLGLSLE